jgi:hypothetical protein
MASSYADLPGSLFEFSTGCKQSASDEVNPATFA